MNTQTVKPELKSPEMKAAYFAQYYGQMILFATKEQRPHGIFCKPEDAKNYPESFVLLTPLEQISDEDALAVAHIHYDEQRGALIDGSEERYIENVKKYVINPIEVCIPAVIDYLRSKDYALPWNGHSVEELIAAGYCQLKPIEQNTASKSIENSIELGELKGGEQDAG